MNDLVLKQRLFSAGRRNDECVTWQEAPFLYLCLYWAMACTELQPAMLIVMRRCMCVHVCLYVTSSCMVECIFCLAGAVELPRCVELPRGSQLA